MTDMAFFSNLVDVDEEKGVKDEATNAACQLLDQVWSEVKVQYPVGEKTALDIAHKFTTAVLVGAIKEHYDYLKEDFGPKQTRMEGLD